MTINWKSFWASAARCCEGLLVFLRDMWSDPTARALVLWLLSRYVPGRGSIALRHALSVSRYYAILKTGQESLSRPSIEEALRMIHTLNLRRPSWFDALSPEKLDRMCNGMGPDNFGATVRSWINGYGRAVVWCSFIHDPAFYLPYNDGTYVTWKRDTQDLWEANSALCVAYACSFAPHWWSRVQIKASAAVIVEALRIGAYAAYRDAFKRGDSVTE